RRDARKARPAPAARATAPAAAPRGREKRGGRAPAYLTVTAGPLTGTTLPLREQGTLIGRNPECALVLDDDYASGRHAKIYREGEQWFAEDLGSTNGSFLVTGSTQQRLSAVTPVGLGTTLRFGKTVVELRS